MEQGHAMYKFWMLVAQNIPMLRIVMVAALVFSVGAAQTTTGATGTGSVQGTVVDIGGAPIPGARVFVRTLRNGPWSETDNQGAFLLNGVPVGEVGLSAYKTESGYPYNVFAFFAVPGQDLPEVRVVEGQVTQNVVIRLGARAAFLQVEITDENGTPVDAALTFNRPDLVLAKPDLKGYGEYRRTVAAKETILVPPVPFRLTAAAEGFSPWYFGGDAWQTSKGLIRLNSGQTLTLPIHLHRVH
jgi:hypothetical protein